MNIILFDETELRQGLQKNDFRFVHIQKILKLKVGDHFSAGVINGMLGEATIISLSDSLQFSFTPLKEPAPLSPITLICGLPRPPVARRIIKDAVTAGVYSIDFITVENSEKSYAQSKLWKSGDYKMAMLEGAQQGVTTLLPEIKIWQSVSHLFQKTTFTGSKIFLDNCTGSVNLSTYLLDNINCEKTAIAIGSERGWTDKERNHFLNADFSPILLGNRILRTETAVTASVLMTIGIKENR